MNVRLPLAALMTLAALCGAPGARAADQPGPRVLMDWFAQVNQGGFWQAQIEGAGTGAGQQVTIQQGGPRIQTIPQVASGQAEFGIANADDILLARMRGAPVKAVFVFLDYVPYTLIYHPDPAVTSIAGLRDHQFAVSLGFAYWEWLKKHESLQGVRELPVSGDLTLFRTDRTLVQQGYSIFLPARAAALGIPNAQFKVADYGYRPYAVMFTTDALIRGNPELVRSTVATMKKAWGDFLDDPSEASALILKLNPQIPAEINAGAVRAMREELFPADHARIGCMTDARWSELGQQLRDVSFLPAGFDIRQGYDGSFVPGC